MKNQYFGDVNDYAKYGLLRILARHLGPPLVHWMLTPDDGRSDGSKLAYLRRPADYRHHDPPLFDALADARERGLPRAVDTAHRCGLIPHAGFVSEIVPEDPRQRASIMCVAHQMKRHSWVFFDPDNGLEVGSCRPGRKGWSKYLAYNEVTAAVAQGRSVLIYQHYPRVERSAYREALAGRLRERGCAVDRRIVFFHTSHVAFILLTEPEHEAAITKACAEIKQSWHPRITIHEH